MIAKHKITRPANWFKQSSNKFIFIDDENKKVFYIDQLILQNCLKSPIIRHLLCIISYKERSKFLNNLVNEFYIFEKRNYQNNRSSLIVQFVSNFEDRIFLEAANAPRYGQ